MKTNDLTRIAMMTAVLCILAPISVPFGSAAISLSTFALYLMAYILKPKQNIAAVRTSRFCRISGWYQPLCISQWRISHRVSVPILYRGMVHTKISSANHTDVRSLSWHIAPVSHRDILAGTHHRHHLFCRTLVRRTALSSF